MEIQEESIRQFKGQTRLPQFAVPKRYELTLKLDLSACTFSGRVAIDAFINDPTKFLVLNALELAVHQVSFTTSQKQKYVPSDIVVDSDDEILVLVFEEVLEVGCGLLEIEFSGVLNEHLKGLYRCTYSDKGEKKNMAASQFEAVDARRCFPCWDEPALKATFKITLENIPSELTALSNMPVSEEKVHGLLKTVHFEESILMSTYLVAVVVGLFDFVEDTTEDGIKVRSYCPVGKSDKGKFALDIAIKTLNFFKMYFSTPYPLPKLDMVAVPEFAGGAMENYGLITFRESELLLDALHSAAANIQRQTIVVAHEVAHHWFGNLVTMEWWTHLWLNEGFATWVSYLVIDKLFPEWNIWNLFLQETEDGLQMDALEKSHPIEVEIPQARAVLEYFDDISYRKGCSVIRMLENFLGDEIFQKSLASYMKKFGFSNAKTEDLWKVISETSGVEVDKIMNMWTKQKGYPIITVKLKGTSCKFEQTHFLSSALDSDAEWIVPVTLCVSSYENQKKFLLEAKNGQLDIGDQESVEENWWVKTNVHQAGFYRVKYDESLEARLRKAIASNCLSASDEFGVLDDAFALCEACFTPFSSLLHLMDTYRKDLEYIVLTRLIDICYSASRIIRDAIPALESNLKKFFISLLLPHAEKLGWNAVPGESQLDELKREQVLTALAHLDHPRTKEEATNRLRAFLQDKNTPLLPVNTRKAAYIAVMRNTSVADKTGLKLLQKLYKEVDAIQEKTRILRCIGSSPDPAIISEVLDFVLTDEVPQQDIVYVLRVLSWEGRATAWTWLKENWDLIVTRWGTEMLLTHFIRDIITPFCSDDMANEAEAFFGGDDALPSIALNLKQSLEKVRIKARWVEHIKKETQLLVALVEKLATK
ncbi:aminopeptidase M1-like [Salvia splendens]|uniref:aminopeptidase M1-like n=1 Tax=Salvia splendens TaxID=180675 RepID=UPI001101626F|nr:aminopeptidase M1-like [Salvia splendens]